MTLALDIPLNDTQFSAQRKSEVLVAVSYTHLTLPTIYSV